MVISVEHVTNVTLQSEQDPGLLVHIQNIIIMISLMLAAIL